MKLFNFKTGVSLKSLDINVTDISKVIGNGIRTVMDAEANINKNAEEAPKTESAPPPPPPEQSPKNVENIEPNM